MSVLRVLLERGHYIPCALATLSFVNIICLQHRQITVKNNTVNTQLNYLEGCVEPSLYRNGKVFTHRDRDGNDSVHHGTVMGQQDVVINDARRLDQSEPRQVDVHGFELLHQPLKFSDQQFFDNRRVVLEYYPECAEIVRQSTNAAKVFAFDHNIRWPAGKNSKKRIAGSSQQVQAPIHYVHGDYTLTSAPQRIRDLADPPGINDTLRSVLNLDESLLGTDLVSRTLDEGKRFALINVWRNIDDSPVMSNPLALCDGYSKANDDLVVFEIHYHDRIGENYFAKYSAYHKWWYYPFLTQDEIILIKQWDSAGEFAQSKGAHADSSNSNAPCTFSLHSAFSDPNTPTDAPERKSVEVRCVAFFD